MAAAKKPRRRTTAKKHEAELPPEAWERQPGESAPAFQAFAAYRDMGADRQSLGGLRKVARTINKSGSLIGRWSTENGWQARVAAWDLQMDREAQRELRDHRAEAARRQAQITAGHMVALSRPTQALLEKLEREPQLLEAMTAAQLFELVIPAARATRGLVIAERLALGVSTENVAGHDGGPVTPADQAHERSDQELDARLTGVDELAARREATGRPPAKAKARAAR